MVAEEGGIPTYMSIDSVCGNDLVDVLKVVKGFNFPLIHRNIRLHIDPEQTYFLYIIERGAWHNINDGHMVMRKEIIEQLIEVIGHDIMVEICLTNGGQGW